MLIKDLLGKIPYLPELYDLARKQPPRTRFKLSQLEAFVEKELPALREIPQAADTGQHILIFATLHYWIEQAAVIAAVLNKMGYTVTLAYLPYSGWDIPINIFDLKRQNTYALKVLGQFSTLFKSMPLLGLTTKKPLPAGFERKVEQASAFDTMYTLQVEDFDKGSELYQLRQQRNTAAAEAAFALFEQINPDLVLIPNGLVTELGVFYQVSTSLNKKTVTYEFNDQREQIWLSQSDVVMNQNTDELWERSKDQKLTPTQVEQISEFENARSTAKKYGKGTRFWQDVASEGGTALRGKLGLDNRPIILLATNVLGDSLTLGRNLFTRSMAEWIAKTVLYYKDHPEAQLVIRIHPGERLMKGPSSMDVVNTSLGEIPENIRIIGPLEKVNTYDLMEIARLGLVYTTTVGLEMAMRGVPVIVAGKTHYRGKGFTLDPVSYEDYFDINNKALANVAGTKLNETQVEAAWNYAYRFFFEYPRPFPWRLMKFWEDLKEWPVQRVLSPEGQAEFGKTFKSLAGEPIDW